ncbi:MAG: phosphotransferase [Methyloprofundus sp.]|nr:phosphotransferase [Methyloprofundus sp.]
MITATDSREKAILHWLSNDLNLEITHFESASSDASFRRYFRVQYGQQNYIVMDAPPEQEDTAPFIKVAELFAAAQVNVPEIIQQNTEQGFLLLQDFGSQCLLDSLNNTNDDALSETLYQDALNSLIILQSNVDAHNSELPHYDADLLNTELHLFSDWFLAQQCEFIVDKTQKTLINTTFQLLIDSALQQAQACVHRDYHSRNLMHISDNNPGIIDFQDAVIGPVTYDAVSLLRDCYINLPDTMIERRLQVYYAQLKHAKLTHCDYAQFKRDFDLMGIQRHLKAIGIFSRLNIRDGKPSYLEDIPRTLDYVINVSQQYPELKDFHAFLTQYILPLTQDKL